MKLIPLNTFKESIHYAPKFTQVSDEDYDYLMQWKWFAKKSSNSHTFYASRKNSKKERQNGEERKEIFMHRQLINPPSNLMVDHKDGNGLNNQRCNLRIASNSQNQMNQRKRNGDSKYFGVTIRKDKGVCKNWVASITINGFTKKLYNFPFTEEGEKSAALLYNEAAKLYYGEFARLNIVEGQHEIIKRKTSSKYHGVSFFRTTKNTFWRAKIIINKKVIYLGSFPFTEEGERQAALTVNNAILLNNGDTRKINIIK